MAVVDSLTAWGLPRAAEIVELANAAGLDLACAATVLEKESGGRNVWGSDGVSTGGLYVKGSTVTEAAYRAYRAAQDSGLIGAQGVGPLQLTYPPLQRAADARGGCWDWRTNVAVGFEHLANLQRGYGTREGFRRYNGSGPAAETYAHDAMRKLAAWQLRLGNFPAPVPKPAPTPAPAVTPTPTAAAPKDEPMAPIALNVRSDGRFNAAVMSEVGAASLVVDRAWLTIGSTWGATHFKVCALDANGAVMPGAVLELDVANNRRAVMEIPSGAVMATVEGHILGAASVPAAALVCKPKP